MCALQTISGFRRVPSRKSHAPIAAPVGTSYQQLEQEGRRAAQLTVKYLKGETLEKSYPIECPPITRQNAYKFKGQF
ncbi:MAG: hypothetical protein ACYST6_14465 [Planctomycetota bacterium]